MMRLKEGDLIGYVLGEDWDEIYKLGHFKEIYYNKRDELRIDIYPKLKNPIGESYKNLPYFSIGVEDLRTPF